MGDYLRCEGYTVVGAGDGEAAFAELKRVRPRIIFVDLLMPSSTATTPIGGLDLYWLRCRLEGTTRGGTGATSYGAEKNA